MRRLLPILLVLTGCSSSVPTLDLRPVDTPNPERPAGVAPATDALADCAGVQVAPYVVELSCRDATVIYAARYDVDTSPEALAGSCGRVSGEVLKGAQLVDGPDLTLPSPSRTRRTAQGEPQTLVACAPYREGGLLYTTVIALVGEPPGGPVESVAWDGIPTRFVTSATPDSVAFLGRSFERAGSCQFLGARNLSCAPFGQMSWELYSSVEAAREAEARKVAALTARGGEVRSDERVPCTFEDEITECRRVVVRAPFPRILALGASNVLVAYYATGEVRGRPSQTVCSFYDDQAPEGGLAPLCREAFALPGAPLLRDADDVGAPADAPVED